MGIGTGIGHAQSLLRPFIKKLGKNIILSMIKVKIPQK
jgi:hypothetical protein